MSLCTTSILKTLRDECSILNIDPYLFKCVAHWRYVDGTPKWRDVDSPVIWSWWVQYDGSIEVDTPADVRDAVRTLYKKALGSGFFCVDFD